jgi:hypothetical protein
MTENLFDAPQTTDDVSLRDELTNKWKDKPADELLKAKVESDLYIKTLERQKDELRTDYLKQRDELLAKAKFEELLDRFEKAPREPNLQVAPPLANEVEPKYDPKQIESLVLSKINETKIAEKETDNFNRVQSKLQERFGNNYHSVLKEQQSTLGLSDTDVNALAKKSPEAFFRLMGLNEQSRESFQTPPRSSQRNDHFSPRVIKRDWNYYQELKKTNPTLYLDPKLSVQMHNDAVELGDAFYG